MNKIFMPGRLSERHRVKVALRAAGLETVCEQARCPNMGECFGRSTATFMILGNHCSRNCGFCAVSNGPRQPPDRDEPRRLAEAAARLGITHVVITSPSRDDLDDGGAAQFAACIRQVRRKIAGAVVEVLVPDFGGMAEALETVCQARPAVLNHNVETVPRLYSTVRPQADYRRSLRLLQQAAGRGDVAVKSGLMVGLGETPAEVERVLDDLADCGCRLVTIGQYLRPTRASLPVTRRVDESEYQDYRRYGAKLGLLVAAGPLVRSSYQAHSLFDNWRTHGQGSGQVVT